MISADTIKIAADTRNYGIQRKSNYIATCKNKICGDEITVEIEVSNSIVKRMLYETESCIFCQGSASLLSKLIKKTNIEKLSLYINKIIMSGKKKILFLKISTDILKYFFK